MRETNEVPHIVEERICKLAECFPSNHEDKERLMNRYSQMKGYEFMNPKSKLYKHFNYKCNIANDLRSQQLSMQNQVNVTMEGNLEQLSVGAMCEILKQQLRKGAQSYEPVVGQLYQQQFIFERDEELYEKSVSLLHEIKLTMLQQKNQKIHVQSENGPQILERNTDKNVEFRKQMAVKEDGSLGAWGGKKYEGLGVQNQFTSFRREQSMSYSQSTLGERKKI